LLDSVDERLRMARARRQHCAAAARLVRKTHPNDYFDDDVTY
jgi:hypothetical protein